MYIHRVILSSAVWSQSTQDWRQKLVFNIIQGHRHLLKSKVYSWLLISDCLSRRSHRLRHHNAAKSKTTSPYFKPTDQNFIMKRNVLKVEIFCYFIVKMRNPSYSSFVTIHSRYKRQTDRQHVMTIAELYNVIATFGCKASKAVSEWSDWSREDNGDDDLQITASLYVIIVCRNYRRFVELHWLRIFTLLLIKTLANTEGDMQKWKCVNVIGWYSFISYKSNNKLFTLWVKGAEEVDCVKWGKVLRITLHYIAHGLFTVANIRNFKDHSDKHPLL